MNQLHDELQGFAPGYVLGILDADERRAFEAHLDECPECAAEVHSLLGTVDALARSVPQRTPPSHLRDRVMASVRGAKTTSVRERSGPGSPSGGRRMWLPIAASVLVALGAGIYGSHLHVETRLTALSERAETSDREIAAARRAAQDARAAMQVIAAPDVVRMELRGLGAAASATARALWSRQHGMVFAGTNLPHAPPGTCYQVWLVTPTSAVSVGILPEPGDELAVFDTGPDIPPPSGVAVTVELHGGAASPTGPRILEGSALTSF